MRYCKLLVTILAAFVVLIISPTDAQTSVTSIVKPWSIPSTAPLLTRWAKDVSPEKVLPEYPRPQMRRNEWLNLNGLWEYADAKATGLPPAGGTWGNRILVPFPVESALSGVMKSAEHLWYRRTFVLPAKWQGQRILLHFGAVDWECAVFINGNLVATHRGGYDPFSVDITDALGEKREKEIIVGVSDPSDAGEQPRGKQVRQPGGIWYTPSSGIWQTVWLEPVPEEYISSLVITPDVEGKRLFLVVRAHGGESPLTVRAIAFRGDTQTSAASGNAGAEVSIALKDMKLWSPSDPFLYDLNVELLHGNTVVDSVRSYFGMRIIEIGKDREGINRILLNGKFLMQVGMLDQGFWPDGLYTAPTEEALQYDLEMTKKLGFNMLRKHVKVEPERWYYWTDKLGILVWQDMPSGINSTSDARGQFELELSRLVETHRNHPSIIMWVVFNEGWGQYDTERLTAAVKRMDPSRLVNNASGWTDMKVGDVLDIHSYPTPMAPAADLIRASVLGEFGGLGLAIEGHTWKKEHWGYLGMADNERLTLRYEKFMNAIYQLKAKPGLNAAIYTQVTDVEVECNGLMTYDRAVVKPDVEQIAAVNRGDFSRMPPPPLVKVILPTSEEKGQQWHYVLQKPPENWNKPGFDDAAWKGGQGGFGTNNTPGAIVRTVWNTSEIWLRRTFTISESSFTLLQFRMHHDEDAEIYINGVLAGSFAGYSTEYDEYPMTSEGSSALKTGVNTIAVHCRQTEGGQYIDVGIVDIRGTRK